MPVIALSALFVFLLAAFVVISRAGGLRFPWVQFYVRGKESGFSVAEVNLLRKVAISNRLKHPTSLFWSVKTLDRCIRSAIIGFRSAGAVDTPRNMEFLNKLFDFRARVEFSQPKYRLGLSSTRGITPGQMFKITLEGGGVYVSKLIETNRRYMAITYPRGNPLPPGFSWKKHVLKVYFWRKEDAGYFFESKVLADYLDRKVPILHVAHVDSIVRAQKRRSVRREVSCPASLYPLKSINQANETIESGSGYRGKLMDISEDGAAVAVGGSVKAGMPVKIMAQIGTEVLILNGVVKSVNFRRKNNVSVLHVQAERPSNAMRVTILTFVYGLFENGTSGDSAPRAPETGSNAESKPAPVATETPAGSNLSS